MVSFRKWFCPFWLSLLSGFLPLSLHAGGEADNAFIVCEHGRDMLQWDLSFLREAKSSIELAACFFGGDVARSILQEIEQRLVEVTELQVHILASPMLLEDLDWQYIDRLQQLYPRRFHICYTTSLVVIWPDVSGTDNHIKMCIIDEQYFSIGGTNLDDSLCSEGTWTPPKLAQKKGFFSNGLPAGVRDQDLVGRGRLAKELRKNFFQLYAMWEGYNATGNLEKNPEVFRDNPYYFPVTQLLKVARFENSARKRTLPSAQIKLLIGGPHQEYNPITQEYVALINSAREEIIIANLYFFPVKPIFQALLAAVNRGVKLVVVTNGVSEKAPQMAHFFCWANRRTYVPMFYGREYQLFDALLAAKQPPLKTEIFEYRVDDVILHKKVMVVDGKQALVGSYNLGARSDNGDYEIALRLDSVEIARDLKAIHSCDLLRSVAISATEARHWYFDLVTSYLGEFQRQFHGLL